MVRNAIRFVLAQDVSVVVTGFKSIEEVEIAAKIGENYKGSTRDEEKRFRVQFDRKYCRGCGL